MQTMKNVPLWALKILYRPIFWEFMRVFGTFRWSRDGLVSCSPSESTAAVRRSSLTCAIEWQIRYVPIGLIEIRGVLMGCQLLNSINVNCITTINKLLKIKCGLKVPTQRISTSQQMNPNSVTLNFRVWKLEKSSQNSYQARTTVIKLFQPITEPSINE